MESIPTLGLLATAYGKETPIEWLVIELDSLNNFTEVKTKISNEQIYELAQLILAEYSYLNVAEICHFVARFKLGKYGEFYGAIDPLRITAGLLIYNSERSASLDSHERERAREKREQDLSERFSSCVTHDEYLALRRRAETGDENAKKILRL